ncbi:putative secreted metallopeptidase [Colletotrichum fructicola Nara gc5]|nr:putative secreted metallopeptidase [Colletotrichum fructicola]KAF4492420.1 putative secreted metallopeptidase [Colletotrichum fructicola Nara gc5]
MDAFLKQQVPSHKDGEQDSISWHSTRTSPPGEPPCATKMQEPGSWKEKEITWERGTNHHEVRERSFRRIRVFILSVLTCASVWWWIVRASPVNFRLTTDEMKLNDGRSGLSAVLAAAVGAFFAGPVASASSGPYTPFEPIDPQNWVNPDNMTWDDWVKPPGTDWSNPARKGSNRNFNIALVVVDYPDRNFTISQPAHSTIFSNPQPAAADVAREKVPTFYRDLLNTPNDLNQGHTLHEYWMEDSAGRFGVDLTAFGAYQLPANGYQYGVSDDMNPGACPTGETCNLNIRTDALSAWRNDVGNDTADAFELVFILSAGQDESSTWQEFGEMKFDGPEDVPDEFGPPKTGNTSLPNWARTRYVPWTSWAAASTLWPNAGGGSSTQGESSGMAVYAHELSHLLDISDNYNNPYGTPLRRAYTGIWSMMSRGSFNGPGGPHTRWQIPALQGSSMGSLHTLRDKYQLGLIERPDILWLSREALATSGIAVADLTARSVDPGDGLMGIRIIMDSDRSPACDIQTEPLCDGGSWDNYDIEVVDRMGSDSFTPDSGVLISKSKNEDNQPFQWVIDAHPEDIELVDFHRPNGSIAMITMGDYRQLADALFHAGTNSGSEFEFIDEANDLHFYIIDRHRNDDGVLSYTVAVRSIGGEGGASVHDVSLEEGQVTALEQNTATTQGVSCSFQLSNSGAYVAVDPNDAQHPEDVSAFLASDVYRLSAEVEGAGWRVEVPNALVTAKFGEVKTAFVSVGASADAADAAVVTLKATSESDPSVAATAQCKVSKA